MHWIPTVVWKESGNTHERMEVIDWQNVRYLRFGSHGGWQGAIHHRKPNQPVFSYQRAFQALLGGLRPKRFLSFGVGTGTALRSVAALHPTCELFGVEIEESVIEIAIRYFDCPSRQQANYTIGDGISFLCNTDRTFDLIFVDAYLKNDIYGPVLDPAFVHVLRAVLEDGGVAVLNLITKVPPSGRVYHFCEEASLNFPETFLLPVGKVLTEQNVLLVLSKAELGLDQWRQSVRRCKSLPAWQRLILPWRIIPSESILRR